MHKTLAVIPAYNEELAIGSVVLRCREYVDEVLVVDDGSLDRTAEVAKRANAVVYRHESKQGKGGAIQSALDYARRNGFEAMVLVDGDGQHDPAEIPQLLGPILSGEADLVCGIRYKATTHMPRYRRVGKRALDYLTAFGAKGTVTDSQCGFRALSRLAIDTLHLEERDFAVDSEMLIDARGKGLRIREVPVHVRYDVEGSTKGPISHGFGVVDHLLRIVAVRHPLLFFGIPGTALFLLGIGLGLRTLEAYSATRTLAIGYALLVVTFLLLGSLSLFAGVILNVMPKAIRRAEDQRLNAVPKGKWL